MECVLYNPATMQGHGDQRNLTPMGTTAMGFIESPVGPGGTSSLDYNMEFAFANFSAMDNAMVMASLPSTAFGNSTFPFGLEEDPSGSSPSATSAGVMTESHQMVLDSLTFYVYCILLPLISAFGILGNTVSILILSRPQMRSSINCCLLALASFDLILIVTSLLVFTFPTIYKQTGYMQWYFAHIHTTTTPWIYPLALIFQTSSVYVTLAVTFERYIAVCLPLRARALCTYGRARLYVLTIVLFSILYNFPRFFEVTTAPFLCGEDHHIELRMVPSELRQNSIYIQVYITWMYLVVMFILPFSVLAVFNFFIYTQVRKVNHERQQLSTIQKREISLAVMILIVVAVFFVCNTMALIINILEINGSSSIIDFLTPVSNLLVTINSSANFVIYCIFGKKFQRLLLNMFCAKIISRFSQDGEYLFDESRYPGGGGAAMGQGVPMAGTGTPLGRSMSALRPGGAGVYTAYPRTPSSRSLYAGAGNVRSSYAPGGAPSTPGHSMMTNSNGATFITNSHALARRSQQHSSPSTRTSSVDVTPLTSAASSTQKLLPMASAANGGSDGGRNGGRHGSEPTNGVGKSSTGVGRDRSASQFGQHLNVPPAGFLCNSNSRSRDSADSISCLAGVDESPDEAPYPTSTASSTDASARALLLPRSSPSFRLDNADEDEN